MPCWVRISHTLSSAQEDAKPASDGRGVYLHTERPHHSYYFNMELSKVWKQIFGQSSTHRHYLAWKKTKQKKEQVWVKPFHVELVVITEIITYCVQRELYHEPDYAKQTSKKKWKLFSKESRADFHERSTTGTKSYDCVGTAVHSVAKLWGAVLSRKWVESKRYRSLFVRCTFARHVTSRHSEKDAAHILVVEKKIARE